MTEKLICCATVTGLLWVPNLEGSWDSHRCTKIATIERNGRHYCEKHDPIAMRERDKAETLAWRAKIEEGARLQEEAAAKRAEMERRAGCFDELTAALNASAMELAGTKASSIARQADLMAKNAALKDQARQLLEALTMVRDADEDCKRDGLKTLPPAPRAKIDAAIENWKGGQPCTTN